MRAFSPRKLAAQIAAVADPDDLASLKIGAFVGIAIWGTMIVATGAPALVDMLQRAF